MIRPFLDSRARHFPTPEWQLATYLGMLLRELLEPKAWHAKIIGAHQDYPVMSFYVPQ